MAFLWLSQRLACANTRWQKARQFSKRLQNQRQGLLVERYERSMHSGSLGFSTCALSHKEKGFAVLPLLPGVALAENAKQKGGKSYTVLIVSRPHLQAQRPRHPDYVNLTKSSHMHHDTARINTRCLLDKEPVCQ